MEGEETKDKKRPETQRIKGKGRKGTGGDRDAAELKR
jgi:hypothetical protein